MKQNSHNPPKWMNWILEWYCNPELLEDLQGDLFEYYYRNSSKGNFRANLIFFIDIMKFCRPYTLRKPQFFTQMTFFSLFANYFKTSIRNIRRHRLFSAINISGLAIAMSVGLLFITYFTELLSYDDFHEKKDRIYRVNSHFKSVTNDHFTDLASTSVFLGQKLLNDYPGYDDLVILRRGFRKDIAKHNNTIAVEGIYSTNSFFDVFSFELISGNSNDALSEPYQLIITEKTSKKLFDNKNPIGEIVIVEGDHYTVAGVVKDPPVNSHIQFEVVVSFRTLEVQEEAKEFTSFFDWRSVWMNYVYLVVPEGQNPSYIQSHLDQIASIENAKNERYNINFDLQLITEILPGKELSNQLGATTSWTSIYQLLVLALIVTLSACFNYTNLSIARSLRRAKEVGIRKAVGATRMQVLAQFIVEAIVIALLALFIAFILFFGLKEVFIELIAEGVDLKMTFQWVHVFYFMSLAIVIGLASGLMPSLFLSNLKILSIFRDGSKLKLAKGISLRKVLVVIQFSLSMSFIMGATIAYRQYDFATKFDLGFRTDNILNVDIKGNDPETLRSAFSEIHEIHEISFSGLLPGIGSVWSEDIKYKDPLDSVTIFINYVDSGYLKFHDFNLIAGQGFPYNLKKDQRGKFVIIDDKLRKRFGFENPQNAVGEIVTIPDRQEDERLQIVGVIEEYQYTTIQSNGEPTALLQGGAEDYNYMNLEVGTVDVLALMDKLETAWRKVDDIHPFEAMFYEQHIQDVYYSYKLMYNVFTFLAFLAISIAAMGLLGMAVFTIETRMKEISVRKVMGASESGLIFLLTSGFLISLLIAAAIAIPSTYLFFERFILEDYVNRIDIGWVEILPGVAVIFIIGWAAISWQTVKAAKTNPAEMLRNE